MQAFLFGVVAVWFGQGQPDPGRSTPLRTAGALVVTVGDAAGGAFIADAEVRPHLVHALREQGVVARDAAGTPMESTSPLLLLRAVAAFCAGRGFESYATLLRHPDLEASLRARPALASSEPAAWLDEYLERHLPARVDGVWLGRARAKLAAMHAATLELLGNLADDGAQALSALAPGGPLRTVGTYSSSWMRPSKVRLLVMSRATSG